MIDGKYQWNVVPFGLATTVSTFQYLMSKVLTSLNHFTFTYLDDVLIFSKSYKEHLQYLTTVFQKFKAASLKIKLSKHQFFKTQLHYLGHKIWADGLEPLPEKLEVIKNLAPAKNMDEAHQILGLLGYYRSFAPAFADITAPVTNLLKKNTPFVWSKQCQDALDYLKEIFCHKPILQFPNPSKDCILYTDASNNAHSSVLCQLQSNDNDVRPVTYFSGTFIAQNKSWCATEKEAYTILKSVQRFDYYLWGMKRTLRCDHKPLEPFLSKGMKIAKLDRWAMLLQEYNITFINIRGKDNILADAISRLCTINIYEDPTEDKSLHSPTAQNTASSSKASDNVQLLNSGTTQQLLNITTTMLWNLQKQR